MGFTVPTTMSLTKPVTLIADSVVTAFVSGVYTSTCGGVVSSVTRMLAVLVVPLVFVATAVRVLGPSFNGTLATNPFPDSGATTPLITTCAAESPTVPLTVTPGVLTYAAFAGD